MLTLFSLHWTDFDRERQSGYRVRRAGRRPREQSHAGHARRPEWRARLYHLAVQGKDR